MIETEYGKIEGKKEDNCMVYRGIPYAAAPVGSLRFEKPVRPQKWEGVFEAFQYGNKSVQRPQTKGAFYQKEFYNDPRFEVKCDEDCLYLNIWVPLEGTGTGKMPVAVYVHGGAFMGGAGSNLPFIPKALTKNGVIVVTINYRLGVFGFMAHPVLERKAEKLLWPKELRDRSESQTSGSYGLWNQSESQTSGNYGLWDQLAALQWVKENIEAFGGNPENITAFGQSAGAMSLQVLSLAKQSEGLFRHMILQSGGGIDNPLAAFRTKEEARWAGDQVLAALNISAEDPEALEKLKSVPAEELQNAGLAAVGKSFEAGKGFAFVPVIDGELLTEDGNLLMRKGRFAEIDYLLGANADDMTVSEKEQRIPEKNPMQQANVRFAQLVNEKARQEGKDYRAYTYYFSHPLPGDESGAFHSAELWYVFGSLDFCWRPMTKDDYKLSDQMAGLWSTFMKTGCMDQTEEGSWPPCRKEEVYSRIFR